MLDIKNTVFLKISESETEILEESYLLKNYFNASYISGPLSTDKNMFIATQGPLSNTIESFWNLIISQNTKLIIMLSKVKENNYSKCEIYWPKKIEEPLVFSNFKIILESEDFLIDNSILRRNFKIDFFSNEESVNICQLHVLSWPDHSVPDEISGYKMIELLLSFIDDYSKMTTPVVIHCRYFNNY
jgi:protein tyrosine phosphatase